MSKLGGGCYRKSTHSVVIHETYRQQRIQCDNIRNGRHKYTSDSFFIFRDSEYDGSSLTLFLRVERECCMLHQDFPRLWFVLLNRTVSSSQEK